MNHSSSCLALVIAMTTLLGSPGASAFQLGNGGTTYSGLASQTSPEDFLGKFIELAHADAAANATLLASLGMADAVKPGSGSVQALDMKSSPGDIANAAVTAGATHQLVTQRLGTRMTLSEADKTAFATGALALTQAARDFTGLTRNLGATKQALTTAGPPARAALYAARSTPDVAAQLRAEVKAVVAFASANQVTLAPEVSEAAAGM